MSAVLDSPPTRTTTSSTERLRATMAAVRVAFVWLGIRKTLTAAQKEQAAEGFGAEREYLSAGKKLLDTSHPAFKAVTSVRHRVGAYWRGISLPYPEPGVRLIRQDDIPAFDMQLTTMKAELAEAVEALDEQFAELKRIAQRRLGSLFNPSDYPSSLRGWFEVS